MNKAIRSILTYLVSKKIFKRHKPEKKILKFKTKYLNEKDRKEFEREYKKLINERIIIREKKKTGKGTEWHIRLNIKKLKELHELLNQI